MAMTKDLPVCMKLVQKCITPRSVGKLVFIHKSIILALTFLAYTSYHMTRKSLSVVKTVLYRNCSEINTNITHNSTTWCDFAPFDDEETYSTLLSGLDSAFLFSYAAAMFVSGFVAERVNLRYYLSLGMIASGIFCCLLGLADIVEIHSLAYFIVIQIFFGISQTTGWPAVVAIVGHWFGSAKRGLIFGIWNSHTSIGNILGSLIAGKFVEDNWALSFIVPGAVMVLCGIIIYMFLVVHPEDVGCPPVLDVTPQDRPSLTESSPILNSEHDQAIGFMGALKIPGVIEFSMGLFFCKLVSYTFLFWLPKNIQQSTSFDAEVSAYLSTLFDVGGIVGAIVAGTVSDSTHMPASTCVIMLIFSIPSLVLYQIYSVSNDLALIIVLLMIGGAFVNGPYALITTAVSAELGTHESLNGNSKALATVTAIIDGTGSIGAAVGPLIAGPLSKNQHWDNVFYFLIGSNVLAVFLLTRLTYWEVSKWRRRRNHES